MRRVAAGRRVHESTAALPSGFCSCTWPQRALAPRSNLAATRWVAERVAITDGPGFNDDCAYAAMDFPLDALGEIAPWSSGLKLTNSQSV